MSWHGVGMNGYQYQAIFSNAIGPATTAPATLLVGYAPTVDNDPVNETVDAGGNASFTATETPGSPAATTVQWQVSTDGGATFQALSDAAPYSYATNVVGGSSTLTITGADAGLNGYEYAAVFSNGTIPATTTAATLTVVPAPLTFYVNPAWSDLRLAHRLRMPTWARPAISRRHSVSPPSPRSLTPLTPLSSSAVGLSSTRAFTPTR